jgi:hypothetical protein
MSGPGGDGRSVKRGSETFTGGKMGRWDGFLIRRRWESFIFAVVGRRGFAGQNHLAVW